MLHSDRQTVHSDRPTCLSDRPTRHFDRPMLHSDRPTMVSERPEAEFHRPAGWTGTREERCSPHPMKREGEDAGCGRKSTFLQRVPFNP